MAWHVQTGGTDLKLQSTPIIMGFVFALFLTWIWSVEISPVQLFNSLTNFENYLIKGKNKSFV